MLGIQFQVMLEEEMKVYTVLIDGAVAFVAPGPFAVFHGHIGFNRLISLKHIHSDEIKVIADDHTIVDTKPDIVFDAQT